MSLLEVQNLSIRFGGIVAIDELSLEVEEGQICSVIGPNGAGKTTLLNCITGVYQPTHGAVMFQDVELGRLRPHRLAALGIARTFQNIALYPDMTVRETVMTGRHHAMTGSFLSTALRLPSSRRSERRCREFTNRLLTELSLAPYADQLARDLPYGLQKRVELARALAVEPKLLLLDEPAAGLVRSEVARFSDELRAVRDMFGTTIVLVEHNMGMVLGLSDEVFVLDFGRLIAQGSPTDVANDPAVIGAYLGSSAGVG